MGAWVVPQLQVSHGVFQHATRVPAAFGVYQLGRRGAEDGGSRPGLPSLLNVSTADAAGRAARRSGYDPKVNRAYAELAARTPIATG